MPSRIDISVVIPTFNRAESIRQTLLALINQTMELSHYEVIVVDDGSTDETPECLARFAAAHPALNLQVERHDLNRMKAAACNKGIRMAQGALVAFVDDDIRPTPGWLEAHRERHRQEKRPVSVTGLVLYPLEWARSSNWVRYANGNYRKNENVRVARDGGLPPNRFAGGNTSVERKALIDCGMFDEKMVRTEDVDLGFRLYEAGVPLLYERDAVVYHYAEAIRSVEKTLASFRRAYGHDRLMLREKYDGRFAEYSHWFLEPIDLRTDSVQRRIAKRTVRLLTGRLGQKFALAVAGAIDVWPSLCFRPLYDYIFACEAIDAMRTLESTYAKDCSAKHWSREQP